jgi:two-component system, OmpR family, phosphate regulon sensor histidine kinase PhoR
MARIEIPAGRFAAALIVVSAAPAIVLAALVASGALHAGTALLAALAMLAGLAIVIRLYLRDVTAASQYVDALARGEEATLPALDHPGIVPELAVAIAHLAASWEKRRRELEALVSAHEAVLDRLPDPLIRLDAQRQVIRANEAARILFGRDLAGRDLAAALRNPALLEAADRVVAGESDAEEVEFAVTPRVAAYYSARLARLPQKAEDGTVAIVALYDLTAIRRSEQLRVDFVANASHELRTPLAVLLGCLDTLEGPARDDAPARERFIIEMRRQATRMSRLVSDLLSLSRIELDEHRRPDTVVDLTRLVKSVAQTMKVRAMADQVEIEVEAPSTPLPVRGDEEQLTQVFQNLIDNAIKYGARNGTVRITARATAGDLPPEMEETGEAVAVAVTDRGEGIPEDDLPRLTERFYRVDKARSRELGGTGLGLAIVKHVLNRHRGALKIDSTLGEGSTFTVYLPGAPPS